jgi:hypothetical protein
MLPRGIGTTYPHGILRGMKTPKIDPELMVCVKRLDPAIRYIGAMLVPVKEQLFYSGDSDPDSSTVQLPVWGGYTRTIELVASFAGLIVQGQNQVAYSVLHSAFHAWAESTWLYVSASKQQVNGYLETGLPIKFNHDAEVRKIPDAMAKRGHADDRLTVLCVGWLDHHQTLASYTRNANLIVALDQYTQEETFPLDQRKNLLDVAALLTLHSAGILALSAQDMAAWAECQTQFDRYLASP